MILIKIIIYSLIFLSCSAIGILISKKYSNRTNELKDFKNALNMFKTKLNFTYEPIPEIFNEISERINSNVGYIFKIASFNMKKYSAGEAWNQAIESEILSIGDEDRKALSTLGKMLGETDITGQISQIEITINFLEEQIRQAQSDKIKNEKMYRTLGMVIGMSIVIILM